MFPAEHIVKYPDNFQHTILAVELMFTRDSLNICHTGKHNTINAEYKLMKETIQWRISIHVFGPFFTTLGCTPCRVFLGCWGIHTATWSFSLARRNYCSVEIDLTEVWHLCLIIFLNKVE